MSEEIGRSVILSTRLTYVISVFNGTLLVGLLVGTRAQENWLSALQQKAVSLATKASHGN